MAGVWRTHIKHGSLRLSAVARRAFFVAALVLASFAANLHAQESAPVPPNPAPVAAPDHAPTAPEAAPGATANAPESPHPDEPDATEDSEYDPDPCPDVEDDSDIIDEMFSWLFESVFDVHLREATPERGINLIKVEYVNDFDGTPLPDSLTLPLMETKTALSTLKGSACNGQSPIWLSADVGVGAAGLTTISNNVFSITASGTGISTNTDSLHFTYTYLPCDGTIICAIPGVQGVAGGGLAGLMMRESLDPCAVSFFAGLNGDSRLFIGNRSEAGATTELSLQNCNLTSPYWLKIMRGGNGAQCYTSSDGIEWTMVANVQTGFRATILVGMAVMSGNTTTSSVAKFENVIVDTASSTTPTLVLDSNEVCPLPLTVDDIKKNACRIKIIDPQLDRGQDFVLPMHVAGVAGATGDYNITLTRLDSKTYLSSPMLFIHGDRVLMDEIAMLTAPLGITAVFTDVCGGDIDFKNEPDPIIAGLLKKHVREFDVFYFGDRNCSDGVRFELAMRGGIPEWNALNRPGLFTEVNDPKEIASVERLQQILSAENGGSILSKRAIPTTLDSKVWGPWDAHKAPVEPLDVGNLMKRNTDRNRVDNVAILAHYYQPTASAERGLRREVDSNGVDQYLGPSQLVVGNSQLFNANLVYLIGCEGSKYADALSSKKAWHSSFIYSRSQVDTTFVPMLAFAAGVSADVKTAIAKEYAIYAKGLGITADYDLNGPGTFYLQIDATLAMEGVIDTWPGLIRIASNGDPVYADSAEESKQTVRIKLHQTDPDAIDFTLEFYKKG